MGCSFETFFYKGLIFAALHLSGKEASLMERLQILAICVLSVFEPSLRNLPLRLSTLVALLFLNSFSIFRTDTELTFSDLSFFSWKLNSLVILAPWKYSKFYWRVRKLLNKITCKISKRFFKSVSRPHLT